MASKNLCNKDNCVVITDYYIYDEEEIQRRIDVIAEIYARNKEHIINGLMNEQKEKTA